MDCYRYYSTQRPIAPGTTLKEGCVGVVNFDEKIYVPKIKREAWGFVDYDRPLTKEEIKEYELCPAQDYVSVSGVFSEFINKRFNKLT